MRGVLLGPQQLKVSLGAAVNALGRHGPVGLVTCGWQEREDQDEELAAQLGRPTVNLKLYERGEQVLAQDRHFARAHRARQDRLRQIQEFYRERLERMFEAALDIARRAAGSDLEADERRFSMEQIRRVDQEHQERVAALREAADLQLKPWERPVIAKHREELEAILKHVDVLAIAGGHVAVLINRLRLFGIKELLGDHALIAWSAGAMATSERVVLFHESPPEGRGVSEVLESGLALHRGVLPLPNPRLRLLLDDPLRVSWFAMRYAPARCVAMDQGEFVQFDGERWFGADGTVQLKTDGGVDAGWAS